jgi:hypothetical protein
MTKKDANGTSATELDANAPVIEPDRLTRYGSDHTGHEHTLRAGEATSSQALIMSNENQIISHPHADTRNKDNTTIVGGQASGLTERDLEAVLRDCNFQLVGLATDLRRIAERLRNLGHKLPN